jgi:hypothetical protein
VELAFAHFGEIISLPKLFLNTGNKKKYTTVPAHLQSIPPRRSSFVTEDRKFAILFAATILAARLPNTSRNGKLLRPTKQTLLLMSLGSVC